MSSLDTHLAHRALAGDRRCCVNGSRQSRRCDDSAIAAETFVCKRKDEEDQIRLERERKRKTFRSGSRERKGNPFRSDSREGWGTL